MNIAELIQKLNEMPQDAIKKISLVTTSVIFQNAENKADK